MIMETEYHIKFPKTLTTFITSTVTFSINNIKSRLTSVLYFKLHCYDKSSNEIYEYTSPRWIIDTDWKRRTCTFDLPAGIEEEAVYTQIELVAIGINNNNSLWFTECMLNEGGDVEYHQPSEHRELVVGFLNSRYVNLYSGDGNFLQVIRPQGDKIETNKLLKSTCTVLAPHFSEESDIDDPINIFMEFINQTEQRIDVLR